MKRFISALMIGALLVLSFTGCGKKGTCEVCGKKDVKVKEVTIAGEKGTACEDCVEDIEALKGLADALK
jgi:hypothetical protein